MHNLVINLFGFLRSCVQFIKVLLMFCILMLLLYWIQNLTGDFWGWFSFMNPFFEFFLDIGHRIAPGSIMLFAAVFEFKFLVVLIIFGILYLLAHFAYIGLNSLEELYNNGRKMVRKFEEDRFNESLEKQNVAEQKRLNRYQIYVDTRVKPKYAHREYNINMDEQNQIMIKFLVEKTGNVPEKFENGFLFTFNSFGKIDEILDIFTKLPESTAPIDYVICVQILGANSRKEIEQLRTLIDLKILNKITMMADTAYRYAFNDICKYESIQVGLFQKGQGSFEVHEFVRKD